VVEQEALYREALEILQRTGTRPERQVALLHELATNVRRQGRFAEAVETDRERCDSPSGFSGRSTI
jgi:Flp pilus assembly protein TadD